MKKFFFVFAVFWLLPGKAAGASEFPLMSGVLLYRPGQVSFDSGADFYQSGFFAHSGPRIILGNLKIGELPLQWGMSVKGVLNYSTSSSRRGWEPGAAMFLTLHLGFVWGESLKMECRGGIGSAVSFFSFRERTYSHEDDDSERSFDARGFSLRPAPEAGLVMYGSLVWHISDIYALVLRGALINSAPAAGFGLELKM